MSLVTTYRDTFASKVRESGVDGLIKALSDKNRRGDARLRSEQTQDSHYPAMIRSLLSSFASVRWLRQ